MESFLVGLVGLFAGAGFKWLFDRYQSTWVNRRTAAAEAFGAAVAVHSATLASLTVAREVDKEIRAMFSADLREVASMKYVAEQSDWHIRKRLDDSKARLEKLHEAVLSLQAIWGPQVAAMFSEFFDLTSRWHNGFATYRDDIHGHVVPDEGPLDEDQSGFNWLSVIQRTGSHAEQFDRELETLMDMIRRFARAAGVAITDVHQLPQGVRDVVDEHAEHREQRQLAVTRAAEAPPK